MAEQNWLEQIKTDLKEILEIVNDCEEPYKEKCFEILLRSAVSSRESIDAVTLHGSRGLGTKGKPVAGRFAAFLSQYGLSEDDISRLVDLGTGDILTTALGTKKAEVQRNLAILIAVFHFAKDGEMVIPKEELKTKCTQSGVYDSTNFNSYMKSTRSKSTVVFQDDSVGWKVTSPAIGYVAETLKGML